MNTLFNIKLSRFALLFASMGLFLMATNASAAADISTMAGTIKESFQSVATIIAAGSYLAGIGFSLGAIMKFKQHKDNPTQIPIGTPIALLFIAAALLFFPAVINVAGKSIFGDAEKGGLDSSYDVFEN